MSKKDKVETVIKWVVAIIFAGIVGLLVWSPFAAQNREQEQNRQKWEQLEKQNP